ncbi:MAG: hypothetical protein ACOY45_05055 [Pseudomonadota bacterium]
MRETIGDGASGSRQAMSRFSGVKSISGSGIAMPFWTAGRAGGLAGLLQLQLAPFALFARITRKFVAEPRAARRLAIGAAAMLLLVTTRLTATAAGWLLLFASA